MNITVIGTGYVGLVSSAIFSKWGHNVWGIDRDQKKIDMIKSGTMPIYEPGLEELVKDDIETGRLKFSTQLSEGVKNSDVIFICVGTPSNQSGAADLTAVWKVAEELSKLIDSYKVVVVKSTVPVGTNEEVERIIKANIKKGVEFDVVSCPEFLREGYSIYDSENSDRIVIGGRNPKAVEMVKSIYASLDTIFVLCDLRSAELIKYASNAFLATKISFINEIGRICERTGADVVKVADGMGYDKRIGRKFLNAGLGYGGSCFPKDVEALYRTSTDKAYDFKLLRGVMDVNDNQKYYFVDKIKHVLDGNLVGKTIGCLGLAFKENTDDVRKSVSIEIIKLLRGEGANIKVFDPVATDNARKELGEIAIEYVSTPTDVAENVDALCVLTEWKEFKDLDYAKFKDLMKVPILFDGRNLLNPVELLNLGYKYYAVGRGDDSSYFNSNFAIISDSAVLPTAS